MTNPDNVGGLPELPEPLAVLERTWRGSWFVREDGLDPCVPLHHLYTADQMRAYGELCRAAPAGGDVRHSTHHVRRGPESLPCYCGAFTDHQIGDEQ